MTRLLRFLSLALAAAVPAAALTHSVTDFRGDWSGAAADTFRLDFGWRDSLLMDAQRYEYKTDTVLLLNNVFPSNNPAASAVASAVGRYSFKVAYLQWAVPHNGSNAGSPGLANVMARDITLSPDTVVVGAGGIIAGQEVPGKYVIQMQWQMACTGRQWCDFVSFDPRLPESMRLFVKRVPRDPHEIMSLEKEVKLFLIELDAKVATLRNLYEDRAAA